jgi:flagellar hook-associated protein 3 FlgL
MVERISTYALHQTTLRNASNMQAELARLQIQLSSGFKSENFAGIASQTEQYISLENKLAKSNNYLENNLLIGSRIDTTNQILDKVTEIATDIKELIILRQNGASGIEPTFQVQLEGYWKALSQQLNTNVEGRYLFSGDRTDVAPVDSDSFPSLLTSGTPDDGYYNGGDQDLTVQADENTAFEYNVRANDPAIQKIFAALSMAKDGHIHSSPTTLQEASAMIQQGIDGVIALQSSTNSNKLALQDINQRLQLLQPYWKGVKEDIINTDLVSVSTQVALDQGILQASFQAFARINSLRLSDFLR